MTSSRSCSRHTCRASAVATLTYVYATSTAVVGPLATPAEPHTYDLCETHARTLTAPRGWQLVRSDRDIAFAPPPAPDDLVALADAVREDAAAGPGSGEQRAGSRRNHLRLVPPS